MDDDLPLDDPYVAAAFILVCLPCDGCDALLESECLSDNQARYPEKGWEIALANEARQLGWKVESKNDNYSILCQSCLAHRSNS